MKISTNFPRRDFSKKKEKEEERVCEDSWTRAIGKRTTVNSK